MFDPNDLLQSTTTEKGSTSIIPIPKGEWVGIIQGDKLKFRQSESQKKGREGEIFTVLDIVFAFDDPQVKEATQRDTPMSRMSLFVDLAADGRSLDMSTGKNIQLNRLRETLGQNLEGRPWAPSMLGGQACKCKVDWRPDNKNPEIVYDEVVATMPL